MRPTLPALPARPHLAGRRSGRSRNTQTHATNPAGQTALGRSPFREEPQHANACDQPCRPDRTWQVAVQGGAATRERMRPTLPARPHLAGRRSGRSRNTRTHATNPAGQTALGRSPFREEPQHANACDQPCRPDRTWQVAVQGGAATRERMRPTLPARPHLAGRRSGRSRNTRTHATNPAGQTALGRSPFREEPQHANACDQPCRPDRTWQVAVQGGAATRERMRPTLPARPHLAGRRSGRSRNTRTHATNPAGQTALGRSPFREEPQHANACDQPCRPDRTWQVAVQGGAATRERMRPTLPARPHLAGRRSGRSRNTRTHATNPAGQTALGRSPFREEPQHANACDQPCRPDRTWQVAVQGGAATRERMRPTLPARPHLAGRRSGRSRNTRTHATNPAGQTALGRSPFREEPQHANACDQPCRPDRTWQVAVQGGAATRERMRPTLPARPHLAGRRSGRSRNTRTHATNPAGQTALGRSPFREEPQHANACDQPCRPDRTWQVAVQGGAATRERMRPTLPARPHLAGRRSGRSRNTRTHATNPAGQTALGRSPFREEPQHANACDQPCRPDRTWQVAVQGGAATRERMRPTLPARPHLAGRRSGRSRNTRTHATNPAGQTALGRSPFREEPQHANACDQPCRPDRTWQVAVQGGAATRERMRPTLPARPHLAGRRSGRSRNTRTHATNPAGQTALGRSPFREEPQHANACDQPCRPDRTWQVAVQGGAATRERMRPTLPARPHLAGRRSGRSHNTRTHATNPAGQTTLGRSPVRKKPQHIYMRPTLLMRPHSKCVYTCSTSSPLWMQSLSKAL